MEIIKVYSDEGKSGLNIKGRDALLQMLADAQSGRAGFFHILVYDVSRWGRSQDMDEAAYYESICNRAGITVHYCAEQSHNDGSIALIIKTIKRSIAVESNGDLLANGLPEDDALDWMI